jgi:signal transduction histidine kinase
MVLLNDEAATGGVRWKGSRLLWPRTVVKEGPETAMESDLGGEKRRARWRFGFLSLLPLRFFLLTAVSVFVVELLVMSLLFVLPPLSPILVSLLDSLLLTALLVPCLYWFLFRPMKREIVMREKAEADLLALNRTLERRVAERTADLSAKNESLRQITTELTLTEERERRRIAGDLHDLVGGTLLSARLKLGMLQAALEEEHGCRVDEIREQLRQCVEGTRTLTFQISNPLLYEVGLEAALESLLNRLGEERDFQVVFEAEAEAVSLPETIKVLLYRVVSELLINVGKHSRAKTVRLTLQREADRFTTIVEDDGVGFEPARIEASLGSEGGIGLFRAREEMERIGGWFKVDSAPGKGTRATVGTFL